MRLTSFPTWLIVEFGFDAGISRISQIFTPWNKDSINQLATPFWKSLRLNSVKEGTWGHSAKNKWKLLLGHFSHLHYESYLSLTNLGSFDLSRISPIHTPHWFWVGYDQLIVQLTHPNSHALGGLSTVYSSSYHVYFLDLKLQCKTLRKPIGQCQLFLCSGLGWSLSSVSQIYLQLTPWTILVLDLGAVAMERLEMWQQKSSKQMVWVLSQSGSMTTYSFEFERSTLKSTILIDENGEKKSVTMGGKGIKVAASDFKKKETMTTTQRSMMKLWLTPFMTCLMTPPEQEQMRSTSTECKILMLCLTDLASHGKKTKIFLSEILYLISVLSGTLSNIELAYLKKREKSTHRLLSTGKEPGPTPWKKLRSFIGSCCTLAT